MPTANGRSWTFNRLLNLWKKRRYSRAQILAAVKAGQITQAEADEILATAQDGAEAETDGGLVLGAAEELETA